MLGWRRELKGPPSPFICSPTSCSFIPFPHHFIFQEPSDSLVSLQKFCGTNPIMLIDNSLHRHLDFHFLYYVASVPFLNHFCLQNPLTSLPSSLSLHIETSIPFSTGISVRFQEGIELIVCSQSTVFNHDIFLMAQKHPYSPRIDVLFKTSLVFP